MKIDRWGVVEWPRSLSVDLVRNGGFRVVNGGCRERAENARRRARRCSEAERFAICGFFVAGFAVDGLELGVLGGVRRGLDG